MPSPIGDETWAILKLSRVHRNRHVLESIADPERPVRAIDADRSVGVGGRAASILSPRGEDERSGLSTWLVFTAVVVASIVVLWIVLRTVL